MQLWIRCLVVFLSCLPVVAFSKDLPNNFVVKSSASNIDIFAVLDAKIGKKEIKEEVAGPKKLHRFKAVLELVLEVQGNLCLGEPEGVSVLHDFIRDGEKSIHKLRLVSSYSMDPYKLELRGCTLHGVQSKIVVPIFLYGAVFGEEAYKKEYVLDLGGVWDEKTEVKVLIQYSMEKGFVVTTETK